MKQQNSYNWNRLKHSDNDTNARMNFPFEKRKVFLLQMKDLFRPFQKRKQSSNTEGDSFFHFIQSVFESCFSLRASGFYRLLQASLVLFAVCMAGLPSLAQNTGNFRTENGIPYFPQYSSDPVASTAGAMYFNTSDNKLYWYNGTQWIPIGGALSMRPSASDVAVTGPNFKVGSVLTGSYTYVPDVAAGAAEGTSTFKWYLATDDAGTGKTVISGATAKTYTIAAPVVTGNYVAFSVTAVSSMGTVGNEVLSRWYKVNPVMADGTEIADATSTSALTWMDRNLGATQVATSSTDHLAYGSLFQWARKADGHQLITWTSSTAGTAVNGTTSTLSASTTPGHSNFIISTVEPFDWLSTQQADGSLWWNGTTAGANSPCPTGYHVPTQAEWQAEVTAGMSNSSTAYNKLKLTMAGYRAYNGILYYTGSLGHYWSSTANGTNSSFLNYGNGAGMTYVYRGYGFSVRCVKNIDKPWAQGVSIASTPTVGAALSGTYSFVANPSTSSAEGTSIYKWYVATDASGTGKTAISGSTTTSYTVAAPIAEGSYLAFSVTPVAANGETGTEVMSTWKQVMPKASDGTAIVEQTSTSSRKWMDRNLGATRVATASDDYQAYGSLFQWARAADGHQLITWTSSAAGTAVNGTTTTLSATTNPGHSNFIINTVSPNDWLSTQQADGSLWWNGTTATAGANNPCPTGYHVPTKAEWEAELTAGITNSATAYSKLKLTMVGFRNSSSGALSSTGGTAYYWSSSVNGTLVWHLGFHSGSAGMASASRASGVSVRCIKNEDAPQAQSVSVSGTPTVGAAVTGTYTYLPPQTSGSAEATSTYKWYKATDATGAGKTAISGAMAKTYTLAAPVVAGNYLAFAVTPVSADGKTGAETLSSWTLVQTGGTTVADLTSTSGRIWMDRNLGATQVATSSTDHLAYGSLFQWARAADGHEKITWTSGTAGTGVNGTTTTLSTSTNPGHSLFIIASTSPYDWLSTQQADGSLWWNGTTATAGVNNPCPTGYHVPTTAEWNIEVAQGITNEATAYSKLKLPMAGFRNYSSGALGNTGVNGHYWSSSVDGTSAGRLYFASVNASMGISYGRANGFSVRCIKNVDAPLAESVTVSGTPTVGATVNGTYTYQPPQTGASAEGTSTFKWYVATNATGTGKTAISGATTKIYTLAAPVVVGNYLAFAVTPVSADGKTGAETLSSWTLVQTGGTTVADLTSTSGRIWMDRNLGATQVAASSTDHLGYGSLFQWARAADGHEKITWTSNTAGTVVNGTTSTLSTSTNTGHSLFIITTAPNDWLSTQQTDGSLWWNGTTAVAGANNPCPTGYHVPTYAEWNTELALFAGSGGNNSTGVFNQLKLPVAGYRFYSNGALDNAGSAGYYWSSSVNGATARDLYFNSSTTSLGSDNRALGCSVRCIKNMENPQAQSVTVSGAAVVGSTLTGSYTYLPPQTGTSAEGTSTYKWYKATDSSGSGKTVVSGATAKTYTVAAPIIDGNYLAFAVTPVSSDGKTGTEVLSSWTLVQSNITTVVDITSTSGRNWMDRNLGATQAATSSTDYLAYGSLFQWVRAADGHEKITWTGPTAGTAVNGTTAGPIASTSPGNSLFVTNNGGTYDWLSTQQANGNLWWSGTAAGANNPCPTGYHVPTKAEWDIEKAGITNAATAYSKLKLPMAGRRDYSNGALNYTNSGGFYWSSSVNGTTAWNLGFYSGSASMDGTYRAYGFSVRCVKDAPVASDGVTQVVELASTSGRVWMDRNMGASQAATSSTDYLAYGSLFQWARAADGHEKITWTSPTAGTAVNGTTAGPIASTSPGNSLFVTNSSGTLDWLSAQQANGNLWWSGTAAGANSPCPAGYHVPTKAEWDAELAQGITSSATAYSKLKLPMAGRRFNNNGTLDATSRGFYWSSSVSGTRAYYLDLSSSSASVLDNYRAYGFNVRCVKDAAAVASDGTVLVELASTSGRVWMDRNMGASQAATSSTDYLAYGSLFQWVRKADGHEKINWTGNNAGTPVNGTTAGPIASTSPGNSLFVTNSSSPYDWLSTQQANGNLWWSGTVAGANNPCPTGYHVPTKAEWDVEKAGITNAATAYSKLKLPVAGHRDLSNGALNLTGSRGYYWSSSVNGTNAWSLYFYSGDASMRNDYRADGFSVRCVKD